MRCLALALVCVIAVACRRDASITAGVRDTVAFRRAVWPLVAPGTPLELAQQRLEREGFVCPTAEMAPGRPWGIYCGKETGGRWAIVRRTFHVALASTDTFGVSNQRNRPHTVATVEVQTWLVGP